MSHRHHRAKYRRSRRGERIFGALVRKRKPIRLDDLSDVERLSLIFGQSQGVAELLEFADGDLLNLIGVDLRDLEAVPGVGPALAAKIYAFLFEIGKYVQRMQPEVGGVQEQEIVDAKMRGMGPYYRMHEKIVDEEEFIANARSWKWDFDEEGALYERELDGVYSAFEDPEDLLDYYDGKGNPPVAIFEGEIVEHPNSDARGEVLVRPTRLIGWTTIEELQKDAEALD